MHPAWQCPSHRCPLQENSGGLVCPCGHRFPLINGFYGFVNENNYADAFGAQWNKYRVTQLDSHTHATHSRDRLARCIGSALWKRLPGSQVLECGCGAGRFTEVLLAAGAHVTSIDLSSAVDANAENCPPSPWHRIAQADILNLPFAPGQYDVVICIGVIQHTPSPEHTIERLWDQIKPGGTLVIDHYTYTLSWYTKTAPIFRAWLRRLPPEAGMRWTERLVHTLLPLHRAVRNVPLAQKLLSRVSPVLSSYHKFRDLSDEDLYQLALLDTHDSLTDWYKHFRTRGQIRSVLQHCGAHQIYCEYGGNGVEARATKPSADFAVPCSVPPLVETSEATKIALLSSQKYSKHS
jgi:SAM-dependent methyltransferase